MTGKLSKLLTHITTRCRTYKEILVNSNDNRMGLEPIGSDRPGRSLKYMQLALSRKTPRVQHGNMGKSGWMQLLVRSSDIPEVSLGLTNLFLDLPS